MAFVQQHCYNVMHSQTLQFCSR